MKDKVLMFGIGATKAGTSWLYRYLSLHPECRMPYLKELHYFDVLESRRFVAEVDQLIEKRAQLRAGACGARPVLVRRQVQALDRWISIIAEGRENTPRYVEYLSEVAGDAKLTADITPAYSLLPETRLRQMQALAPVVRFVYLLRDPVDRLWSNIRMQAARKTAEPAEMAQTATDILDRFAQGQDAGLMARSDYAGTMTRLRSALRPENLMVAFYETFFSVESLSRLCGFLGISVAAGNLSKRVHEGVKIALPQGDVLQRARRMLAPQYDFIRQSFGTLPDRWQMNMAEV